MSRSGSPMPEDITVLPDPPRLEHQLVALVSNMRTFYMWCRDQGITRNDPQITIITHLVAFEKRMPTLRFQEGDRLVVFHDTDNGLVLMMAQYRNAQAEAGQFTPTPEWFE